MQCDRVSYHANFNAGRTLPDGTLSGTALALSNARKALIQTGLDGTSNGV